MPNRRNFRAFWQKLACSTVKYNCVRFSQKSSEISTIWSLASPTQYLSKIQRLDHGSYYSCLAYNVEEYRSGHNEAVLKTVWVKAHGGSNPSSSATKTRQILSGFLLLRKRASCAICDCTRLRRRTPYHGADASLLRVNSPAPLLNESSSSANKTDKHFCLFVLFFGT